MSSNLYPEPPKLSSAKTLMKKPVQARTPKEEPAPETDSQPELGSMVPEIPAIPEKIEPVAVEDVETPEPAVESLSVEDVTENIVKETLHSETSDTDVALGQEVKSEEGTEDTEDKEDSKEDTYGGPWGIIKHTGYVPVAVWAVLTAVVTGASAYFFAPGDYTWIALGILGFMTGVIAAVDRKTHLIKNQHTIATAIVTIPLSVLVALNLNALNIVFGLLAAALVFGVFIFLIIKVNFGSGGDIKFSPVPAFALGVVNPLISALWLFYALIITVILLIVRKEKRTSFGEGMAISFPFAIASVYALYSVAGLPYMETTSL